jgi:hypothetical protein
LVHLDSPTQAAPERAAATRWDTNWTTPLRLTVDELTVLSDILRRVDELPVNLFTAKPEWSSALVKIKVAQLTAYREAPRVPCGPAA